MAENSVRIDSIAGSFQTSVGTAVPGPNLGVGLQVATGTLVAGTALTAQATTGAGSAVDFGSGRANVTLAITTSAGVSAGAVALELSHDQANWFRRTAVTTNTASTVFQDSAVGAWRYARANVTTAITGGTVSATIMAS
jgi:hypothetical protein